MGNKGKEECCPLGCRPVTDRAKEGEEGGMGRGSAVDRARAGMECLLPPLLRSLGGFWPHAAKRDRDGFWK